MPRLFRLWHQYQNYHLHPVVEKRAHAIGGMHARTYARRLHQLGCLLFAQRGHLPEEVLARRPLSFHNDGIAGGNGLPGGRGSGAQRRLGHLQQHRALVGDLGTAGQLQPIRRGVLQILIRKRESMKSFPRLFAIFSDIVNSAKRSQSTHSHSLPKEVGTCMHAMFRLTAAYPKFGHWIKLIF